MKQSTQQISLFLVAISASSSALASTCVPGQYDPADGSSCIPAPLGSYVPTAGASVATPASPGYFVSVTGASEQTPAPPGYFIASSGATAAQQAQIGYYVPFAGASAQTPAGTGFYTLTAGATSQIPAGGLAAPLTAALQTSEMFNGMSTDLLDTPSNSFLKLAASYQHNTVDQDGLSSGDLDTDIGAAVLQANLESRPEGNSGLQLAYGHHNMKSGSGVRNDGDSFEAGAFRSGSMLAGRYQAFLVYGQTDYDNRRNVAIDATGTNLETLTSDGTVKWYGLRTQGSYPLADRFGLIGQLGVLRYETDDVQETGVATASGSPTASIAGLSAASLDYIAVPAMLGVSYDLLPKTDAQYAAPVTLEAGLTGNLNRTENLRLTPTAGSAFNLPVTQSSPVAGLLGVKVNAWEIGDGFSMQGIAQGEIGSDTTVFRAGFDIIKRW